MKLQRYDIEAWPYDAKNCPTDCNVTKHDDGEWVKATEHLALIEKMKCCYNCQHFSKGNPACDTCADKVSYGNWRLAE